MPESGSDATTNGRPRRLECPRCGYDQRGVIESWTDRCPLDGACTECGLKFRWRDILHPTYTMPAWCVEARQPALAWPGQVASTLGRAIRPGRYWSAIGMHQRTRWARLIGLAVSLVVVLAVAAHVTSAFLAAAEHRAIVSGRATSADVEFDVFLRVLLKPLSNAPVSGYVVPRATGGPLTFPGEPPSWYWQVLWIEEWQFIFAVASTPLWTALAFAALPWSRRRAKVRGRHVVRVALHATMVPATVLFLCGAASLWSALDHPPYAEITLLHRFALGLLPIATFAWWEGAARRYLHMEHSWAVAASTVAIGVLAPVSMFWGLVAWM